jgi:hypothetical protein
MASRNGTRGGWKKEEKRASRKQTGKRAAANKRTVDGGRRKSAGRKRNSKRAGRTDGRTGGRLLSYDKQTDSNNKRREGVGTETLDLLPTQEHDDLPLNQARKFRLKERQKDAHTCSLQAGNGLALQPPPLLCLRTPRTTEVSQPVVRTLHDEVQR